MALKAFLTTLEGLSDAIKAEYTQVEGGFQLDVAEVNGLRLSDGKALKTALETERTRARKLEEKYAPLKEFDTTVLAEAAGKLEEIKSWSPDQKTAELIKARETELGQKHQGEVVKVKTRAEQLQRQLEDVLVVQAATAEIAAAGGKVKLLLPVVRQQIRPREVDGRYVVEVVDGQGNARIGSDAGSNMTIKELIAEMKTDSEFKMAFAASGQSDGGSPSGNNGGESRGVDSSVVSLSDLSSGNFDPAKLASGQQVLSNG